MNINGTSVNFDRKIYLTIAKNSAVRDGTSIAGKSRGGVITLVFDPQKDRQYCPRIEAIVSQVGRYIDRNPINATAKISVWNLSDEIKQFLDGYNAFNERGVPYNMVEAKKSAVVLQVGYGNVRHTLYRGWIGSFFVERRQTSDVVDNVWQFACAYPGIDVPSLVDKDRAVSGNDYLNDPIEDFDSTALSPELQLKQIVYRYPRTVFINTTTQAKSAVSFLRGANISASDPEENMLMTLVPATEVITPQNFSKYFVIKYVSDSNGTDPDDALKNEWQNGRPMYLTGVNFQDMQRGMNMLAILKNCRAIMGNTLSDGRQEILILRAGTNASSSRNWVIKNFQNVLQPPQIGMGGIVVPIMLEPDMRPMDSLELQIDDSFVGAKLPSFSASLDRMAYQAFIAGNNFSGVGQIADSTNAAKSAKYGNIFFKRYNISHLEHSISSHTETWRTVITTRGPDMNRLYREGNIKMD